MSSRRLRTSLALAGLLLSSRAPAQELEFTPYGWTDGVCPVQILADGHPIPLATTRALDRIPVTLDLPFPAEDTVTFWETDDAAFLARDVSLTPEEGGSVTLTTAARAVPASGWAVGGSASWGDPFITWTTGGPPLTLSFEVFNLEGPQDIRVMVNGAPVHLEPDAWDPTAATTVTQDITGFADSTDGLRITVLAERSLDGGIRDVRVEGAAGEGDDYAPAVTDALDTATWSHFGHTHTIPDLDYVTFIDPGVDRHVTLQFYAYDFDEAQAGVLLVNGGWVQLDDQRWSDGERVSIEVTGYVEDPADATVSWWTRDDTEFGVGWPVLVDEVSGVELPLEIQPLYLEELIGVALVSAVDTACLSGRTWHREPASVPDGLVCGLYHNVHQADSGITCQGYDANDECPPGYTRREGGDHGLSDGEGYVWCEAEGTCSGDDCDLSLLPSGAVCGLYHTGHQSSIDITCLGESISGGTCPDGWTFRDGGDRGSRSNGYTWCELTSEVGCSYLDCSPPELEDIACGLGHSQNDSKNGTCQYYHPRLTGMCPDGFTYAEGGDHRMPAGLGFTWCYQDSAAD